MTGNNRIKVWDPFVRVFHWLLVAGFFIAWFTEDELLTLHSWAGYLVFALVVLRILWGFVGTRHARFRDFVRPPAAVLHYLGDILRLRAPRYIGHNPAGGAMIVALLASILLTSITGLIALGIEGAGPLAALTAGLGGWEEPLEEIHEFFANLTLLLVFIHVGGVLFESWLHRENLIRAMWDGYKRRDTHADDGEELPCAPHKP